MMRLTSHAETRLRQRGFNSFSLDIISNYGRVEPAPDGALKVFLGKKEVHNILVELKSLSKMVDRAAGGVLILKDDCLLTAYKQK